MRRIVEQQEEEFLRKIGEMHMDVNNERNDNMQSYRVDVEMDDEWLLSNLRKIGNVGVVNSSRQDFVARRAANAKALNWKYSGRIDALSFVVNKSIELTGVALCTPFKIGKTIQVDEFKVLAGETSRSEVVYLHSEPTVVNADLDSGVFQVRLEAAVRLESNAVYTLYFKISGAKTFKCVDSMPTVRGRDGAVFEFRNTRFVSNDESNRSDMLCGPIAELYYVSD